MIAVFSTLSLGLLAYLLFHVYKSQNSELKIYFWPGLFVRLSAGIALGITYTFYYTVGDTFGFFEDAQKVSNLIQSDYQEYFRFLWLGDKTFEIAIELTNLQTRSLFLVKILSVISMISFGNYWIATFYFSTASFLGSWYLLMKINECYEQAILASVISFLGVPSFLFWSSGIIKESLAISALLFLAGIVLMAIRKIKLQMWEWTFTVLAVLILWNLKYYWAAVFIPSAIATLFVARLVSPILPKSYRSVEYLAWMLFFSVTILLASTIHPNFYIIRFLTVIVENHNAYTLSSIEKPFIHFSNLAPNWMSIIKNSPWALISGLYRPFIFEATTLFQMGISLENTVLLFLTIFNLKYISRLWNSNDRILVFGTIVFILLLATFLTLSTPNFGTLSRYRVGFLPFLFFLLLYNPIRYGFKGLLKLKLP